MDPCVDFNSPLYVGCWWYGRLVILLTFSFIGIVNLFLLLQWTVDKPNITLDADQRKLLHVDSKGNIYSPEKC